MDERFGFCQISLGGEVGNYFVCVFDRERKTDEGQGWQLKAETYLTV